MITRRYEDFYLADMGALGVRPPDIAPHATQHVEAMIAMIAGLIGALYVWGLFFYDEGEDAPVRTVLEVEWLPIDAPSFSAEEAERPYASSVPSGTEDIWRVYVSGSSGAQALLLETNRRPGPAWSASVRSR